jgi:ATP phosphoribosyltransferase regulatory subunit
MPELAPAVEGFAARLDALAGRGIEPSRLRFDAGFGRAGLEYYDGFVFAARAPGRADLPPIASGGRYDSLTRALGSPVPAVGGMIRPEALVSLCG